MTENPEINTISKYAAPHRDRWHYLDYRDGKHDGTYTEWKYFNFIQGDVAGYIQYFVHDPELKTPLCSGRLLARIMRGEDFHGGVEKISMDKIEFDTCTASARFGDAHVNETTPHNYEITGTVSGVSWNLAYSQSTPTLDGFENAKFGILPWEKASWLVKMPRARVTGTISVNGADVSLDTFGYSDTNWGEFIPYFSRYEWAQFNDEKVSVVLGVIYRWGRMYRTYAYVEINREIINFDGSTYKTLEREWANEKLTSIRIPKRTRFELRTGEYVLDCEYATVHADMLSWKVNSWLPKPAVAEQISKFTGTLKYKGDIVHSFSGLGFSEYSPKTWKNTPVTF
jgi:hypothetical protein